MNKRRRYLRSLLMRSEDEEGEETVIWNEDHDPSGIVSIDRYNDNLVIRFLINEHVYGFPETKGTFFSNFKQFTYNNHPLLSLFLAHKLHPLTRTRRFCLFFCTLFFAVAVSYTLSDTELIPDLAMCRDGCDDNKYLQVT